MAITTKYLESLGIERDIAAQIFAERGKEIADMNAEKATLEKELAEVKESLATITSEADNLRSVNADGLEWKKKFEALQADIEAKEKQAEADKILKAKQDDIESRFNAVLGDKKFNHEAIRESYLKKFGEALDSDDYKGKGDNDIFHALVKDDSTAFEGVTVAKLAGGTPNNANQDISKAKARAVMGLPPTTN